MRTFWKFHVILKALLCAALNISTIIRPWTNILHNQRKLLWKIRWRIRGASGGQGGLFSKNKENRNTFILENSWSSSLSSVFRPVRQNDAAWFNDTLKVNMFSTLINLFDRFSYLLLFYFKKSNFLETMVQTPTFASWSGLISHNMSLPDSSFWTTRLFSRRKLTACLCLRSAVFYSTWRMNNEVWSDGFTSLLVKAKWLLVLLFLAVVLFCS